MTKSHPNPRQNRYQSNSDSESQDSRAPESVPSNGKVVVVESTTDRYPLTHGQRALWFMQQLVPKTSAHHVAHAVRISSQLEMPQMRRAFQRLVDRHTTLRTTFTTQNGAPVQEVHAHMEPEFCVEDASGWDKAQLDKRLEEEVYRPFDLKNGPLLRVNIFTLAPDNHLLLLMMHHIITDMWSLALLIHEVSQFYQAEMEGEAPNLKNLRADYADQVQWEREMLAGPEGEKLWSFWQQELQGELPLLNLPTDRPRSPVQSSRGGLAFARLDTELVAALRAYSKEQDSTLFMTMLAAFQVLLHRYTGQDDILVGTPKARRRARMARNIGYFVNPIVLRANMEENPTFATFLRQVRETVTNAFAHDAYPFPLLVERIKPDRDLSRPPIFQAMFSWQKTTRLIDPNQMSSLALGEEGKGHMEMGGIVLEAVALDHRPTPFDWTLLIGEAGDELGASVEYNADLFTQETVERMLGHYQTLLAGIVADPERPICELPLVTPAERQQLLYDWNQTAVPFPERCVHHQFEDQVSRTPENTAVDFDGRYQLTYQELNQKANQLAHYLRRRGVGPETMVGISVERSPEMVIGLLGILKAGGAYLPLDASYPSERLAFMLQDSQAPFVLTTSDLQSKIEDFAIRQQTAIINLDTDWPTIAREPETNPDSGVTADNLAYVIYTSGSTGRPKGVLLPHLGLANLVHAQTAAFGIHEQSRVLQFASFSFDASVSETFMALLRGATLCLAPQEKLVAVASLADLLTALEITAVTLPPSVLSLLPPDDLPGLEVVISAGEACPPEVAARWSQGRWFFNAYGPTEATIGPTLHRVHEVADDAVNVPIGRPIANMQVYILDGDLEPLPVGVPGEIHIGGVGIGRGYLNRPSLTQEKFVPNPFLDGVRLYKTGDLGRFRPDGAIEFLGRIDQQVKVRGFRIELGEIEVTLSRHEDVCDCAVTVHRDDVGDARLLAYVVPNEGSAPGADGLRAFLGTTLPDYMIPAIFITLDELPLTPNGKVDRRALPQPTSERPELETVYVKPRSTLESAISEVWQQALGLERIGIQDNFFDLGGHSLLLARVHGELQEKLDQELPLVEMFRYPTIAALADFLGEGPDARQAIVQESIDRAQKQKVAMNRQKQQMRATAKARAAAARRRMKSNKPGH